jgi:diacylglycerol O-acyltransferase / wax synthase
MDRPDRATSADLMQLSSDAGSVLNQVAGVILLDARGPFGVDATRRLVAERLGSIPRLRQQLRRSPAGRGRPVWVDDPGFDAAAHVHAVICPGTGDERALLDLVATTATTPLPTSRPRWSATLVTGLSGDRVALVLLLHHVIADGIGGLAVLTSLVDGSWGDLASDAAAPAPPGRQKDGGTADQVTGRRRLGSSFRGIRVAVRELVGRDLGLAPRCSLNQPTGPHRRLALARADLAAVQSVARANGGTVNDAILTAVTGALRELLRHRGERPAALVISVPVSARTTATTDDLGNRGGILRLRLPTEGDPRDRLRAISAITGPRKHEMRGASSTLLAPLFRWLVRLRIFRWFIDHQRLVNTFVTNLHGPERQLSVGGAPVTEAFLVSLATGNASVAFAVLSYAGTLVVTVVADADLVPDLDVLAAALQVELDRLSDQDLVNAGSPTGRHR